MKIVLVISDLMDALYADGKLVATESPIYISEGVGALISKFGTPLNIESYETKDADPEWVETNEYPDDIRDVKF
jgi:hypothetical protein